MKEVIEKINESVEKLPKFDVDEMFCDIFNNIHQEEHPDIPAWLTDGKDFSEILRENDPIMFNEEKSCWAESASTDELYVIDGGTAYNCDDFKAAIQKVANDYKESECLLDFIIEHVYKTYNFVFSFEE